MINDLKEKHSRELDNLKEKHRKEMSVSCPGVNLQYFTIYCLQKLSVNFFWIQALREEFSAFAADAENFRIVALEAEVCKRNSV